MKKKKLKGRKCGREGGGVDYQQPIAREKVDYDLPEVRGTLVWHSCRHCIPASWKHRHGTPTWDHKQGLHTYSTSDTASRLPSYIEAKGQLTPMFFPTKQTYFPVCLASIELFTRGLALVASIPRNEKHTYLHCQCSIWRARAFTRFPYTCTVYVQLSGNPFRNLMQFFFVLGISG